MAEDLISTSDFMGSGGGGPSASSSLGGTPADRSPSLIPATDFMAAKPAAAPQEQEIPAARGNPLIQRWAQNRDKIAGTDFLKPDVTSRLPDALARGGKDTAAFADLILSMPGFVYGQGRGVADTTARLLFGENKSQAYKAGNELAAELSSKYNPQLFTNLLKGYETSPEYDPSNVDRFMEGFAKWVKNYDERVSLGSGGKIPAGATEQMVNTAMAAGAFKGMKGSWDAAVKKAGEMEPLTLGPAFKDEKPRFKLTDQGPARVEELAATREAARLREAEVNAEAEGLPPPPKPRIRPAVRNAAVAGGAAAIALDDDSRNAAIEYGPATALFLPALKHPSLPRAKEMSLAGLPREQIWKETGLFQGVDGKWRYEISDHEAKLTGKESKGVIEYNMGQELEQVMDHPELYEQMPKMEELKTLMRPGGHRGAGRYTQGLFKSGPFGPFINVWQNDPKKSLSTLLHETQHGIQDRAGFDMGTSSEESGYGAYRRNAGEVEARAVQARQAMTPEERRATPPWESYEYAENQQLRGRAGRVSEAVKGKGGMWHPEAVERLAAPLVNQLARREGGTFDPKGPEQAWSDKAIRNYLNKYAGTEGDPLKDVEIPFREGTKRWEDIWDSIYEPTTRKELKKDYETFTPNDVPEWVTKGRDDEVIHHYKLPMSSADTQVLTGYLSHVGDFLRQNVDPAKLPQYDLVRAVKETAANDARVAKEMEKAAAESSKDLPVYKSYPDGFKWVELKLADKLTEEQAKRVRPATEKELNGLRPGGLGGGYDDMHEAKEAYIALDSAGKPVKNSYTGDNAFGKTPAEAFLAGQLAQEGNIMGHCVGGYCAPVASGESRIFSLRDKKGQSHVTVEVAPANPTPRDTRGERATQTDDITQIKGKQNRAPNAEYLPYVQDFVKGGKWGEVGDINNTGLVDQATITRIFGKEPAFLAKVAETFPGEKYISMRELDKLWEKQTADPIKPSDRVPGMRREEGKADLASIVKVGAVAAGALAGAAYTEDSPWLGGVIGAVGVGLAPSIGRTIFNATRAALKGEKGTGPISEAFAADPRIRIKEEMDRAEIHAKREELRRSRLVNDTIKDVPEAPRREAIAHFLEGNRAFQLSSIEAKAAEAIRKWFVDMGQQAQKLGIVGDLLDNYVTHVWGKEARPLLDELMKGRSTGATTSPFAKERTGPPTIAEVNQFMEKKGRPPITADIAKIVEAYGNSITKAISNKMLVDSLKKRTASFEKADGSTGTAPLVMQTWKAPGGYKPFGNSGLSAHPDIIGPLRFAFDAESPILAVRAMEAVNTAAKRSAVSFSLFHAKALVDAMAGGAVLSKTAMAGGAALGLGVGVLNNDPITYAMIGAGLGLAAKGGKLGLQAAAPSLFGENRFVKALRENDPALAKLVDLSFEGGLNYTLKRGALADVELGGQQTGFYQGLKWAQQALDKIIPGGGLAIKGLEKMNHAVDGFMWERLHTAMKLEVFAEKYEILLENNVKANAKNPEKVKLFSEKEVAERAASYTNDIFGGLNWRRMAEETHTRWGRDIAMGIYSPKGQRILRLAMFAPDWTISTTRAALKAFGPLVGQEAGSGVGGLFNPKTVTDLHRQYMLRSAFYYALVGDGLNYAFNGKHLWQEDDPTYIHLPDGRKIQYSKHTMEPYHWVMHPVQQGLNKLGQIPKEGLNQVFGTEYLYPREDRSGSITAGPKMKGSRLGHAARSVSPIGVQQFAEGPTAGISGALGVPIYGKTAEQKDTERRERRRKRIMGVK